MRTANQITHDREDKNALAGAMKKLQERIISLERENKELKAREKTNNGSTGETE